MRVLTSTVVLLTGLTILAGPAGATVPVPMANGGFELLGAGWSAGPGTSFGDFDADLDFEALVKGSGGNFVLSRGIHGGARADSILSFDVEKGRLIYDVRIVITTPDNLDPYTNNYLLNPNWFDDQVLFWQNWGGADGHLVFDPVQANAANVPGWGNMDAVERAQFLGDHVHAALVIYAVGSGFNGGATLDNFVWDIADDVDADTPPLAAPLW